MANEKKQKKRNTMYYNNPDDMEQMRYSDLGAMDSGDPLETDGYAEEEEEGGWMGEPNFSVPLKADQTDDLKLTKLRKKGMPSKG